MSGPTLHPAHERQLRVALLPWMVAGVRTQYENLRLVDPPAGVAIDVFPIVPYREGGLIERLPVLRSSQKGTLRSTTHALPLLTARPYDALWTQALLPLLPLLAASDARLKRGPRPAIVYTIDTTPRAREFLLARRSPGVRPRGAREPDAGASSGPSRR